MRIEEVIMLSGLQVITFVIPHLQLDNMITLLLYNFITLQLYYFTTL